MLNRMGERKQSLTDVMTAPQQYQGFNSKEYQRIAAGKTTKGDEQKLKAIDAVLAQMKSGTLTDNTEGRTFYTHHADGSILATKDYPYAK